MPVPLRQTFDYLPLPEGTPPAPGVRVLAPFGRTRRIGVVIASGGPSGVTVDRLKPIAAAIDAEPVLDPETLSLLERAARYYHHPIGEVIATALPALLRKGAPATADVEVVLRTADEAKLTRAPKQAELLAEVERHAGGATRRQLRALGYEAAPLSALVRKGLVRLETRAELGAVWSPGSSGVRAGAVPVLGKEQQAALSQVTAPGTHLLYGITGSGKTEVYLRALESVLEQGRQALVLVPEIGLTPQTIRRFSARFDVPIDVLHSGLTDSERLAAWRAAAAGAAAVVIGTRSAVFTRFRDLGLIVVDEEHDASYKQMDGFRYSARDLAVMRGARARIPVILGTATPALETYANARSGKYSFSRLESRAGGADLPPVHLIDVRQQRLVDGFSAPLIEAMHRHLDRDEQVLVFLNRRGFAEALLCRACGWLADCPRCDARMTYHRQRDALLCHHCGTSRQVPQTCPQCESEALAPLGAGTERIESGLQGAFPDARLIRVDRDTTRGKRALEAHLEEIGEAGPAILVGTQLLAKGHHFPNVTLVAIVDADSGFFSADFKAMERMGQLIVQVAGRAGRAEKPGTVIMQTHVPDHPALTPLRNHDYLGFADQILEGRRVAGLPPTTHAALLRAESQQQPMPMQFLSDVRRSLGGTRTEVWGPVPSPMERRQGRFRAQLLLVDANRSQLAATLARAIEACSDSRLARRVRWSADVDPLDLS